MKIDLENLTIKKAHEHLLNKDFSSVELFKNCMNYVVEKNKDINAYIELFDDMKEQAKVSDKLFESGDAGVLAGIPIAVKDNMLVKGKKSSAASKILENHTAVYDGTVIRKLKEGGAVFLGRTNMDEFAMGSSTETSYHGITKNPHDLKRVPGGSSGGSAAAVAMGGVLGALGSDTGGSIRQPAAFCGVVGLKPTYGAVSRYGLMAMASSFDQIGPITKTVEDAEIIFNSIKGHDKMDSTSVPDSFFEDGSTDKKKMTIGVPTDVLNMEGVSSVVRDNFNNAVKLLEANGYTTKEISLANIGSSLAVYYIIMPAEASTNLARYDGVRYGLRKEGESLFADYAKTRGEGFGREVRRRIMLGTFVLSSGYYDAYYNRANSVRRLITEDFSKAFSEQGGVDVIVMPTTPTPAFKIGEKINDPLTMYLADIFTVPMNIAGLPAISVPSGFVEEEGKDIPLGVQFVAPHFKENRLFATGGDFMKFQGK